MKRVAAIFLCFVLMIASGSQTAFISLAAGTPTITCESKECYPGDTVTVEIKLTDNPGIMYLEITPTYSSELGAPTVQNGSIISDLTKGKQYIWVADNDVETNGTLASMTFTVAESVAPGDYSVSFIFRSAYNYDEESVAFTVVPATITVKSCSHEWDAVKFIPPTSTEGGYINYKCTMCGATYVDNITAPLGSPAPTITVENAEITAGDPTATMNVTISNNPGVWSLFTYLSYDKNMSLTSVTAGEVFTASEIMTGAMNKPFEEAVKIGAMKNLGTFFEGFGIPTENVAISSVSAVNSYIYNNNTADGIYLTLTFDTSALEAGTYEIWASYNPQGDTINCDFEDVGFELVPGTLTVSSCSHEWDEGTVTPPTCTEQGCTTYKCTKCGITEDRDYVDALGHTFIDGVCVTCGMTEEPDILLGDVNADGRVTSKDILTLRKYLADETLNVTFAECNADISGDGKINSKDILALSKHIADSR